MNNLSIKLDNMEKSQKEVKRLRNVIEAESKILRLLIEEANRRGVTTNAWHKVINTWDT